jgi:hypothetical protein
VEAIAWIGRGGRVKVLTEAIPWTDDTLLADEVVSRKRAITHHGLSGSLSVRVGITLVGYFADGCPNLDVSQRCNIYKDRPLSCRIYPYELNPAIPLNPSNKLCPPQAWETSEPKNHQASQPLNQRALPTLDTLDALGTLGTLGTSDKLSTNNEPQKVGAISIVDSSTREYIKSIHMANTNEITQKNELCALMGINSCSLSNDGYLFHLVDQERLLKALNDVLPRHTQPLRQESESAQRSNKHLNWVICSQARTALAREYAFIFIEN